MLVFVIGIIGQKTPKHTMMNVHTLFCRCRVPASQLPFLRRKPYVVDVIFLIVSSAIGIVWFFIRHYRLAYH